MSFLRGDSIVISIKTPKAGLPSESSCMAISNGTIMMSSCRTWAVPNFRIACRPQIFSLSAQKRLKCTFHAVRSSFQPRIQADEDVLSSANSHALSVPKPKPWKPMCLYYTQNMCTKMDDPIHLEKFNHCYSLGLQVGSDDLKNMQPQQFDYFLVLDLEGMVEILEFPVVMIDARTVAFVDAFHRFVRPVKMSEKRIEGYIKGKYGKWGLDRVWHDTAIPFTDMLQQFEIWLTDHHLWGRGVTKTLHHAAFVTCGNWDVKTKIPQQCEVSGLNLPPYFKEWVNLKDVYLNFYQKRATGMVGMLKGLSMPVIGTHHVGLDDAQNIARILQHMIIDGALLKITARRTSADPTGVKFYFKDRIK